MLLRAFQRSGSGCSWVPLAVALLAVAAPSASQDLGTGGQPFDITADSVEYDSARGVYVARGQVHIEQEGRTLDADWVAYNPTTKQGMAIGNVVIREGLDVLRAESIHFEADELKGIVYQGHFDSGGNGFQATSDQLRKTGPRSYEGEGVTLTTCRCPEEGRDPWALRAGEAELEVDGYATTKNNTLEILGVPVFWFPWLRFPVKTERESGFLLPDVSLSGRNGASIGLPVFWAARDDLNVTATPQWLSERGFKIDLELEYVMGERGSGEAFGAYISDNEVDPTSVDTPFGRDRWSASLVHDQDLPWGFRLKSDARFVSDNQYPLDFDEFRVLRNDRFAEAVLFIEKGLGTLNRYGFQAATHLADDLQNPDDADRDDFLIQRLPDLRFSGPSAPVGFLGSKVFWSFDSRYTYYTSGNEAQDKWRNAPVVGRNQFVDTGIDALPDDYERNDAGERAPGDQHLDNASEGGPEGNGVFDEGEPLADRGSRIVLNPRLEVPFQIGDWLEVSPEAGYHGTIYSTDYGDYSDRHLATGLVDVRTRLRSPAFSLPFGLGDAVHLLEPRLTWTGVTDLGQRSNPLFVPQPLVLQRRVRQLEPTAITRDPADRIDTVNAVTAALGNRVYRVGDRGGQRVRELWLDTVISFKNDFSEDALRNIYLDGTFYPLPTTWGRFNFGYDFDKSEVAEAFTSFGWSSPVGHDIAFSYRFIENVPRFFEDFSSKVDRFNKFREPVLDVNQIDFFGRWAVTENWALSYNISYSFAQEVLLANRGAVEYISRCKCWAIRVQVEDDRTSGVRVGFNYTVIGLGDDSIRPFSGTRRRRQESFIENPNRRPTGAQSVAPEPDAAAAGSS